MNSTISEMEADITLFSSKPKRRKTSQSQIADTAPASAQVVSQTARGNAIDSTAVDSQQAAAPSDSTCLKNELDNATVSFRDLGLTEWLENVCSSLGIQEPTAVQRNCIPHILQGQDVIGIAHTGSGKTAAFALPILQKLAHDPYGVFALVLTPTRELAFQISDQFRAFGAGMSLKETVVIGGMDFQTQARTLAKRPHVVIATPGRLKELLVSDSDLAKAFQRIKFLVLDEADRVLDTSFEPELREILSVLPQTRQTLLFSATMTKTLVQLQKASLSDAYVYRAYQGLVTAQGLVQQYLFVPAKVKEVYLTHLLENLEKHNVRSAIIFCGTCKGCHLLGLLLEELSIPCVALHSRKPQKQRLAALDKFKSNRVSILLATDVASRGLDIPSVDLVVNFDLPVLAQDYVHRVGRTARAGRRGWSVSMVTQYDIDIVHQIEELIGQQLVEYKPQENEVLKGISRVYAARRQAGLRMIDDEASGRKLRKGWVKRKAA